jgi:hypothetical protein
MLQRDYNHIFNFFVRSHGKIPRFLMTLNLNTFEKKSPNLGILSPQYLPHFPIFRTKIKI